MILVQPAPTLFFFTLIIMFIHITITFYILVLLIRFIF